MLRSYCRLNGSRLMNERLVAVWTLVMVVTAPGMRLLLDPFSVLMVGREQVIHGHHRIVVDESLSVNGHTYWSLV